MESQVELNDNRIALLRKFRKALPELMDAEMPVINEVYKDGVVSGKMKRLMSLALALGAGCVNCILGQTMGALDAGATREEILETLSVVVSMRGTTGIAESLRVIELLDELGTL
jgi:AhpD family alkylhydroperoxidase